MPRLPTALLALAAFSAAAAADDAAVDSAIVSAQVRDQGYACAEPATAVRDVAKSKPGEAAYVLTCADASYSVILIPDQGARITPAQ